ncbi:hypothetical protein HRG84_13525 [Flavisolibacter sp. BT320]|nr:hypothetical protein [Flavisolibacter longurius]
MNEENIRELQAMLEKLGFSGRTAWELEAFRNSDTPSFHLFYGRSVGEDTLLYGLAFQRGEAGNYSLTGYDLSLTRVEIPNVCIRDIDALVLEQNLKEVDKYYDYFLTENWSEKVTKEEYDRITGYIEATNAALERLASWMEGEEVAKLLMFKYWPEVRYRQHFSDYTTIENRHRIVHHFSVNPENIITANQSYQQLKSSFMNEKNFEYLKDTLKYNGFGEGLAEALKEQMKAGAPAFHMSFEVEINKKAFSAVLSFRKSENTDMYFFNSYHATLRRSNGDVKDQAFYLNKGKGVTAKEAFNLLEGRVVYKELENREGQKYHAWLQIDFSKRDKSNNHELKQYHEAYGYDLKEALAKFPIRDIKEPDLRDILLASLQKGNLQAVAFEKEGGAVRMFVEANPQYKTVNLYDSELKRVTKEELQKYQVEGKEKVAGKEVGKDKDAKKEVDKSISTDNGKQSGDTKKGKAKDTKDLLPQKEGPGNKKGVKLN